MTPQALLHHNDTGQMWTAAPSRQPGYDLASAYRDALAVRALRIARGEVPCGFKIGFTNRGIWPRYQVFAPMWGTVWNTTLVMCDGVNEGALSLGVACQPRIEPETVFGMRATPAPDASVEQLFDAIGWIAPGFEIVQSHLPHWKFAAPDTVADGGLHARLLVGRPIALRDLAESAAQLKTLLAGTSLRLLRGAQEVERGLGANVLDGPLLALHHFLGELRGCPGAPDLMPGDVVTTGTWTDAWPVAAGEVWTAEFDQPLAPLRVSLS